MTTCTYNHNSDRSRQNRFMFDIVRALQDRKYAPPAIPILIFSVLLSDWRADKGYGTFMENIPGDPNDLIEQLRGGDRHALATRFGKYRDRLPRMVGPRLDLRLRAGPFIDSETTGASESAPTSASETVSQSPTSLPGTNMATDQLTVEHRQEGTITTVAGAPPAGSRAAGWRQSKARRGTELNRHRDFTRRDWQDRRSRRDLPQGR
jgi:hypothetical protein